MLCGGQEYPYARLMSLKRRRRPVRALPPPANPSARTHTALASDKGRSGYLGVPVIEKQPPTAGRRRQPTCPKCGMVLLKGKAEYAFHMFVAHGEEPKIRPARTRQDAVFVTVVSGGLPGLGKRR